MSATAVLALDQGTSGTKALVVCPERGVLSVAEVPLRPRYGDDGSVEQDPDEMWESVVDAGRAALAGAGEPVSAVGLANQGESVLAWDPGNGVPITPVVGWQDRRADDVCRRLAGAAEEVAAISGLPLDAYFAAAKLAWVRENLTRDGVVTTTDAWLLHRLSRAFVTDASTASRTQLLDLGTATWSPRLLAVFGLDAELLPDVVDGAGSVGETGAFGDALPITGLAVDQQAALLAEGCLEAGDSKCTYGTGAFLLVNAGDIGHRSRHGLSASVAWRLGGETTYCLDGQVFTVSAAVRWLTDLGVISGPADLDRLAWSVPDAGGTVFVPALAGLGAPWWRGDARGALTGLRLGTTAGHLVRALCDGIAAQVVAAVEAAAADTGRPRRRCGSTAGSPGLLR